MKPPNKNILEIKANSAHDELIRGEPVIDQVRIIDDVAAEEERAANGEDEVHRAPEGDEDPDYACHYCTRDEKAMETRRKEDRQRATRPPKSQGPIPEKSY
jgi:hypothetical protein